MTALAGRTALVTGASRGIGKAILLELARSGAIVVGTATSDAGAAAITSGDGGEKILPAATFLISERRRLSRDGSAPCVKAAGSEASVRSKKPPP